MATSISHGKSDAAVQNVTDAPHLVGKAAIRPLHTEASALLSSPPGKEYRTAFASKEKVSAPDLTIDEGEGSKSLAVKKNSLDAKKPLGVLAKEGSIVDKTVLTESKNAKADSSEGIEPRDAEAEKPRAKTTIDVALQDRDAPEKTKAAHFTIGENGDVIMNIDPEKNKDKEVKVVLERKAGQLNPTDAQKEAVDELVKYLSRRLSQEADGKQPEPVALNDKDGLVSNEALAEIKANLLKAKENYSPETREQIGRLNRFNGSGGVDMPMTQSDGLGSFETRQVPRQVDESDKQAALKEVVAGLFNPDQDAPYETIRKTPDGIVHVGRYGLTAEQIEAFMSGLGDPPDPAKIEALVKQGKLPKDFAEKLKNPQFFNQMKEMLKQIETGKVSPELLQEFLPKQLQETIAQDLIEKMKGRVGEAPGAVAAAVLTGKSAENISPLDISTSGAMEAAQAGEKLYKIAIKRFENQAGGSIEGTPVTDQDKRSLIVKALELARPGQPVTEAAISAVNTIVEKESSWNPKALNDWDSNAKAGIPSQGLMQTIPPTFKENALPGYDKDITDPLSNLIAGIRYSDKRYGGVETVVAKFKSGGRNEGY
jgi:hypothetical protein